jgi:hypothetical protein
MTRYLAIVALLSQGDKEGDDSIVSVPFGRQFASFFFVPARLPEISGTLTCSDQVV